MQHPNVFVQDIARGAYGDPRSWTFGSPEDNYIDLRKLVRDAWYNPWVQAELAGIRDPTTRDASWREIEASLLALDPKLYGAHPINDPSVCYTHIELTKGGPVWFTIRWWVGDNVRTFFDLVDVRDKTRVLCPRRDLPDLDIEIRYWGVMFKLNTLEEEIRRSQGASRLPFDGEERYAAPPGASVYIYRKDLTNNGRRRHIANAYVPLLRLSLPGVGLWSQTIL